MSGGAGHIEADELVAASGFVLIKTSQFSLISRFCVWKAPFNKQQQQKKKLSFEMISSICQRTAHEEKFLKMTMERAHDFPLCFVSSPQFLQHDMSQMCPTQSLWSPWLAWILQTQNNSGGGYKHSLVYPPSHTSHCAYPYDLAHMRTAFPTTKKTFAKTFLCPAAAPPTTVDM